MKRQLAELEKSLQMLRKDLDAKQGTHQTATLGKQELLTQELHEMPLSSLKGTKGGLEGRASPIRKDELNQ